MAYLEDHPLDDLASKEAHPEVIRLAFVLLPRMVGHPVNDLASKEVRPELEGRVAELVGHAVELGALVVDRVDRP